MLEMRPDCERCGADLPPSQGGAFICSLETTFCAECAEKIRQKRTQGTAAASGSGAVAKAPAAPRRSPSASGAARRMGPKRGAKQRPGTGRRTKTAMRKRKPGATQKRRMFDEDEEEEYWDEPQKSNLPLVLGIGGGGLGLGGGMGGDGTGGGLGALGGRGGGGGGAR